VNSKAVELCITPGLSPALLRCIDCSRLQHDLATNALNTVSLFACERSLMNRQYLRGDK